MSRSASESRVTAACPLCGGASAAFLTTEDRNRLTGTEPYQYRRCRRCASVWLENVPTDLAAHYPSDYHDFPSGSALEAAADIERARLGLIADVVSYGRLVEIGPSQGVFAYAARRAGFDVTALEMDPECCAHLDAVIGVRAIHTADPAVTLGDLPSSRAVVLWHVIEHLPNPVATLRVIAANLEPGGVLALATPNPTSLQFNLMRRRWVHLDAPRHLTLLALPALRGVLNNLGLGLVRVTTEDPVGRLLTQMGWERVTGRPPVMGDLPRLAYASRVLLGGPLGSIERRGMRGATYTAIFRKNGR